MAAKYRIVAAPAVEPVTLAEAKKHARVFEDLTDDDAMISSLIVAAREKLEASVCRSFITRTIEATFDRFPDPHLTLPIARLYPPSIAYYGGSGSIRLLYPPVQSIESITYLDGDGVERTIDPADYVCDPGTPGVVAPAAGKHWPYAHGPRGSVKVTFLAGDGDGPADVPEVAKLIIKILVAHWYDRREPIVTGSTVSQVPFMVDALSDSLRWGIYP